MNHSLTFSCPKIECSLFNYSLPRYHIILKSFFKIYLLVSFIFFELVPWPWITKVLSPACSRKKRQLSTIGATNQLQKSFNENHTWSDFNHAFLQFNIHHFLCKLFTKRIFQWGVIHIIASITFILYAFSKYFWLFNNLWKLNQLFYLKMSWPGLYSFVLQTLLSAVGGE